MARSNTAAGQNGVARRRAGRRPRAWCSSVGPRPVHRVVAPGRRFLRGGPHLHELQWRRDRKVSRIGVDHKPAGPAAAGDLVAAGQHDNAVSESRWPLWRRGRLEQATAQKCAADSHALGKCPTARRADHRLGRAFRRKAVGRRAPIGRFLRQLGRPALCADSRGRLSLQRYWRRWLHLLLLPGHRGSRHAL